MLQDQSLIPFRNILVSASLKYVQRVQTKDQKSKTKHPQTNELKS